MLEMHDMSNHLRELLRPFVTKFIVAKGPAKGTESTVSLFWSGTAEHLAYFQTRVFSDGNAAIRRIGRRPISMLRNMLAKSDPSLGAVVLNRRLADRISRPEDLVIPLWVDCRVDLDEERKYAESKSLRVDLRNIRKNELVWRISSAQKDLDYFYEQIYLPTITASHGRAALLANRVERLKLFERGEMELLLVERDSKVIAGVTIDYRQQEPVLRDSGVLGGSLELKKTGAIAALNLFSMDHLASRGYRAVGFGMSRSFLDDGVLTFKRKFRPIIRPGSEQCLLVRTGRLNSATRTILRSSSCITWQGPELHRTYFRDAASQSSSPIDRKSRSDWHFGIENESIIDISGETMRTAARQENRDNGSEVEILESSL
jgi:hypothetical protein